MVRLAELLCVGPRGRLWRGDEGRAGALRDEPEESRPAADTFSRVRRFQGAIERVNLRFAALQAAQMRVVKVVQA